MSYSSELKSLRKMNFQNTQSVQKKSSYQSALDSLRSMDSFPEAQQEQQTVAPAPSAPATTQPVEAPKRYTNAWEMAKPSQAQIPKKHESIGSRIVNTVKGGAKQSIATNMDAIGVLYEAADHSDLKTVNEEIQRSYERQAQRFRSEYNEMLADNQKAPGTWPENQIQATLLRAQKAEEAAGGLQKMNSMDYIGGTAKSARDYAATVANSGARDIERAKEGTGTLGGMLVDAGASMVQMAGDSAGAALGFGMAPFAFRAFGGGTMQARSENPDSTIQQQLAFGGAEAAKEVFTEKLFGIAMPFRKVYGKGILDNGVEGKLDDIVRAAVNKLATSETGAKVIGTLLKGGVSGITEGLEELIGDWIEWQMPRIYGGDVDSAAETLASSIYDFGVGALTGTIGAGIEGGTNLVTRGTLNTYNVGDWQSDKTAEASDKYYSTLQEKGAFSTEARKAGEEAKEFAQRRIQYANNGGVDMAQVIQNARDKREREVEETAETARQNAMTALDRAAANETVTNKDVENILQDKAALEQLGIQPTGTKSEQRAAVKEAIEQYKQTEAGRAAAETAAATVSENAALNMQSVGEAAATLGTNGSKALRNSYNADIASTLSAPDAYRGFTTLYDSVRTGSDLTAEQQAAVDKLPQSMQLAARASAERDMQAATQVKYFKDAGFQGDRPKTMSYRTYRTIDTVAKALGVKVQYVENLTDSKGEAVNGDYQDGVIRISSKADNPAAAVFSHEVVHRIRQTAPDAYAAMVSFVQRNLQNTGDFVDAAYRETYGTSDIDAITEEKVADAFSTILQDEQTMNEFAKQHRTAAERLLDAVNELIDKIKAALGTKEMQMDDAQRALFRELQGQTEEMSRLLTKALGESEAAAAASMETLMQGEGGTMTDATGADVATGDGNGHVMFSRSTWKASGRDTLENFLQKQVSAKELTAEDAADMMAQLDFIYDVTTDMEGKYAPFGAWSNAEVIRDAKGKPVFSVVKSNGEYKMNLDFSLVCKKRRTLDAVFNELIRRGSLENFNMGERSIVAINDMIRDAGFETACALCFVDSKRFRQALVADSFTSIYNNMVRSMAPAGATIDYFNFGKNGLIQNTGTGIDTMNDSELDFTEINRVMREYGAKTVEGKTARYLKAHPDQRKLLLRGDFMSTAGFDALKGTNPGVLKLYNSKKGTGGPKAAQSDVQYLNEIIKSRTFSRDKAYSVGGVRIQSFSDYIPRLVFDYAQMVADLAAKKLPAHAYSKESSFVMQFGKTGIKINMSLVPDVIEGGVAPGLDANGNYAWRDGQSFGSDVNKKGSGMDGFKLALKIQNADGYSANCGTIAVGVSDQHILKMLGDPDIRMVIPYHKSSLNHIVAAMNNIDAFTDYTETQNTRTADGKSLAAQKKKDFSFNDAVQRNGGDAKAAAKEYLEWCAERNYIPKFNQFAWHENYYKLLEDFNCYDKDGTPAPQGDVRVNFPVEGDAFGPMSKLIEEGLDEDAVLQGRQDAAVGKLAERIEAELPGKEAAWDAEDSGERKYSRSIKSAAQSFMDITEQRAFLAGQMTQGRSDLQQARILQARVDVANEKLEQARKDLKQAREELTKASVQGQLVGKFEQGKRDAKEIRKLREKVQQKSDALKQASADARKAKDEATVNLRKAAADARLAGQMAQGRADAAALRKVKDKLQKNAETYKQEKTAAAADARRAAEDAFLAGQMAQGRADAPALRKAKDKLERVTSEARTAKKDAAATADWMYAEGRLIGQIEQGKVDAKEIRKVREDLAKEQARRENQVASMKEHARQVRENRAARKADSAERTKLLNVARRLKNIKVDRPTRALINELIGELDTVSKGMTGKTFDNLFELHQWYAEQARNDPDFIRDAAIEDRLDRLGKVHINSDMTIEQVRALTDVLLNIENNIRSMRKFIDSQERRATHAAADQIIKDVRSTKGNSKDLADWLETNSLSPLRMVRRMTGYKEGSPLYTLTKELNDGQRVQIDFQMRASHLFDKWTNNVKFIDSIRGKNAQTVDVTGIENGETVTVPITRDMVMALYLHSLNDQNLKHIRDGGVTIPDLKILNAGKVAEAYDRGHVIKLSPSAVRGLALNLTAEERAFANEAKKYFNGMSQEEINTVSEKLVGYSIAGVENYFPINTDTRFSQKEFESLKMDGTIEGMGFLKERQNAANPIMLRGMTDVLNQSIRQTSKYVGLAIPVRNFGKVWGTSEARFDNAGNVEHHADAVQKAVTNQWGERGTKYIEKMMTDIQTEGGSTEELDRLLGKARSAYAGATLTLNAGVALKQAASYPTAGAVVGGTPLAKALPELGRALVGKSTVDTKLIEKHTPLLWYRSQGFSTTELGNLATAGKQMPKWLNWIQAVDIATTKALWKAAEYYVQGNNKALAVGSDAYYRTVADVYNRIIEETQPNYTTMQRPQILRSDSSLVQSITMFKTQPMQNFNILYDAAGNLIAKANENSKNSTPASKAAVKEAQTEFSRAAISQVAQLFVFAAMTAAWKGLRKKDEDYRDDEGELTAGSVGKQIGKDMVSGLASMVLFGSEAYNALDSVITGSTYYGIDSVSVSAISDMASGVIGSINNMRKLVADAMDEDTDVEWLDYGKKLFKNATDISKITGIPVKNFTDICDTIIHRSLLAGMGKYEGEYSYLKFTTPHSSASKYYDLLFRTILKDQKAYEAIRADMIANGFDESKIDSEIKARRKKANAYANEFAAQKAMLEENRLYQSMDKAEQYKVDMWLNRYEAAVDRTQLGERFALEGVNQRLHDSKIVEPWEYALFVAAKKLVDSEGNNNGNYDTEEINEALKRLGYSNKVSEAIKEINKPSKKK